MFDVGKKKIFVTVTEDYVTSYGNNLVTFKKGWKVWEYEDGIFECQGRKMILAKNNIGLIIGFLDLSKTDFVLQ